MKENLKKSNYTCNNVDCQGLGVADFGYWPSPCSESWPFCLEVDDSVKVAQFGRAGISYGVY